MAPVVCSHDAGGYHKRLESACSSNPAVAVNAMAIIRSVPRKLPCSCGICGGRPVLAHDRGKASRLVHRVRPPRLPELKAVGQSHTVICVHEGQQPRSKDKLEHKWVTQEIGTKHMWQVGSDLSEAPA